MDKRRPGEGQSKARHTGMSLAQQRGLTGTQEAREVSAITMPQRKMEKEGRDWRLVGQKCLTWPWQCSGTGEPVRNSRSQVYPRTALRVAICFS